MTVYPSDQAFPNKVNRGLTKREYFAAQAMQGLCQHLFADADKSEGGYNGSYGALVRDAVSIADALIKALNQDAQD